MELLTRYFPELNDDPGRLSRLNALEPLYREWNSQINVISRKDLDGLYEKHVLHSLSIAKKLRFNAGARVLDVGTGGGFPGIPLAIFFPQTEFVLVDSIGKKIKVVQAIADALELKNVHALQSRMEELSGQYDFIVSRAVAPISQLLRWTGHLVSNTHRHAGPNSWLLLKGGDLHAEISEFVENFPGYQIQIDSLSQWFGEEFFETKKLLSIYK